MMNRKLSSCMQIYCWGSNSHGQLGLGSRESDTYALPSEIQCLRGRAVKEIGCGQFHTVFVMQDGTVFTCGGNDHGQLGHDKETAKPEQVTVLETYGINQVACGSHHTIVITSKGQLLSWGRDEVGQCGWATGNHEDKHKPKLLKTLSSNQVIQVACGTQHNVALTRDGSLYSWGDNKNGQLGLGSSVKTTDKPTSISTLTGLPVAQLSCGGAHTFATTFSGTVFGWGKNDSGQLGLGDTRNRPYPTLLKSLRSQKVKYVTCGEDHTAMITVEGGVFTFGAGTHGRLGHNTTNNEVNPRKVFEFMGTDVTQVACGRKHTVAYASSSGRLYSFGLNASGQLGREIDGQTQITPAIIKGPWTHCKNTKHLVGTSIDDRGSPMHSDDEVVERVAKQLKTDDDGRKSSDSGEDVFIKALYTGGFQSFCLLSQTNEPLDFRILPKHKQLATIERDVLPVLNTVQNDMSELPVEVKRAIETVFQSAACLNASLLQRNNSHYGSSRQNHGVDLDAARQAFHVVANYQLVVDHIAGAIHHLAPFLPKSPPDIEALRLYLLMMECPVLDDPAIDKYASCSAVFGQALLYLENAGAKVLSHWWSTMQPRHLNRILTVYKKFVQRILELPIPMNSPAVHLQLYLKIAMGILDKLFKVNMQHDEILPHYLFYIPEIARATDLRNHFVEWLIGNSSGDDFNFCDHPFVFDAQAKTQLLEVDGWLQMKNAIEDVQRRNLRTLFAPIDPVDPCLVLYVVRENIVQSTLGQLAKQGSADFKKPLKIVFQGEEAVDAGGVRKEFFMLILKEILDPKYGMFKYYQESRRIWFNPKSFEDSLMFGLVGIVCGLAIYNHIIVTLPFPLALYKKLLNRSTTLEDLKQLDPVVMSSMQSLLDYEDSDVEETFGLVFQISEELFGEVQTEELKPGGADNPVTSGNKQEYVDTYLDYILNKSVRNQYDAFSSGFLHVCGGRVLDLFHPQELMDMVIGDENYDWEEFEKHVEYKGEYYKNHPTIIFFWQVFKEMSQEKKKKFLAFLTGNDRVPIQGMKSLKTIIQPVRGGTHFFPVAHTCFNLLDMPIYKTKAEMENKLLTAIEHSQGFGLA